MHRPPRRRTACASSPHHTPWLATLVFCTAQAAEADLTAFSLEQLLDLQVVGASKYEQKQNEVAAAVSVITRQEIKAFGWRTLDDALGSLPGVFQTYDRQYAYLGTRGFGLPGDLNTRLLVAINGNRQNDPTYDAGAFGRQFPLDMDLVERIEFIPGPGGAVYGQNAMFGVINVVTREGASLDGTELALAYQSPQGQREGRASWGKRLENGVDVLLSVSALRSRGQDLAMDFGAAGVSGLAVRQDGERDREFFARIEHGAWSVDLVRGRRAKDDPTGVYRSDPLVAGQYQDDSYVLAQAQYQSRLADDTLHLSARLFAGQERYRSDLAYTTVYAFPAHGDWRGAELRLLSTAFDGHKLMLGLEAQDNRRQDQAVLDRATPANDLIIANSGHRVGLFGQDEWRVADTLTATLGLRLDHNTTTGSKLSPRGALIWQASPESTVKLLYGRAHRAPNAYERDYDDGLAQVANPALRGERIDTVELVTDHRVSRDLALRGAIYRWDMQGLITLGIDPVSGISQFRSGNAIRAHGLELSADQTWTSGVRLRTSASLQSVAYATGAGLLNSPRLLGKVNLSAPLPWAGTHAGYEYRVQSRRLTLDGTWVGGYALSRLHLSWTALAPGLEVMLDIGNLFGKRYAHPGSDANWQNAIAQDGRTIGAGLAYRY